MSLLFITNGYLFSIKELRQGVKTDHAKLKQGTSLGRYPVMQNLVTMHIPHCKLISTGNHCLQLDSISSRFL